MRLVLAAMLALLSAPALASPVCSHAGPKTPECAAKLDYCRYTSIVLVLAYRARVDGKTEDATFARLSAPKSNEVWYQNNSAIVKDIVHQMFTIDSFYEKLKAEIAPTVIAQAQAISAIDRGCDADPKVVVDSK